jgi:hypothetical protein
MKPSSYILCLKSVQSEIKTHEVATRLYASISALHEVVEWGGGKTLQQLSVTYAL